MAVVTVVAVEAPTAVVATVVVAAASTAVVATVAVAPTVVAASMEDRPTAAITAVDIAAGCMAAATTMEVPALEGLGPSKATGCGTLRPDFIRLPDQGAEACLQLAAERWVLLAAPA
jgi:hypothetical protein